ncbi:MAG: ABC transporter ATP-binding protein [Spirochaetia bacterium]
MENVLEVSKLRTYFHMHDHLVRAVDGVDFTVKKGEVLGIVGESGCGKSITSLSIMRLVPSPPGKIETGKILFKGENLLDASIERMRKIRGNDVSMIFQEPMTSLNPVFTVGFQIGEVLKLHRGMEKKEAVDECARLLDLVGISEPRERVFEYPFQLSGGLRQRVMIAMAMACEPSILIADEPTTALDVTIQAQILRLMRELKEKTDSSIMFITHDLAVIASFTDRVMVMYAGVVVESAPVKQIFAKPLHPYTQGLLSSIPVLGDMKRSAEGKRMLLRTIPGTLPDPRNFPKGCRFAPRCPQVMPKCHEAEPALVDMGNNQQVRCYLHSDEERKDTYEPKEVKDKKKKKKRSAAK